MANSARIDELRQKFDENPRRYFAPLANEYRKAGDLEQAIFICQEYLPQQPGHMSGHIVYGQALYESGRYDDAKGVFETALSLDPENLIALRHLGDIARQDDDVAMARAWYQRALEVDPRNDEILALIESLPGRGRMAEPIAGDWEATAPSPSSLPASPEFASKESELEVERSEEAVTSENPLLSWREESGLEEGEEVHPAPPPPAPAPPEATADELLDLGDLSFEGLSGAEPTPDASVEAVQGGGPIFGGANDAEADGDFMLREEDALFGAGFPTSAGTPSPDIELATDLELGLLDDGTAQTTSTPPAPLSGLESFEAGSLAVTPPDAPALEIESFFDVPPVAEPTKPAEAPEAGQERFGGGAFVDGSVEDETTAASAPIDGGHDGQEVPEMEAAAGEVFVTETMAELYVQQGHLESALDIYRKLVEQRPGEPELRDRLRAIEDRLFGPAREAERATPSAPSAATVQRGPTIREFLNALISSRASRENGSSGSSGSKSSSDPSESERSPEQRSSMRATPNSRETVSGSIDALFSGAIATASDSMAAITLSDAFAPDEAEAPPLEGTPAHRAEDELSLDHVFRANQPSTQGAGKDDFSFDEFFAEEANEGMSSATGDSSGASAPDDIAQFNAWLNGLKKT